jgi:hypothetical protein
MFYTKFYQFCADDVLDLDQLDLPKNPQDYTEEQLETVIATKMREYRISIMREYGPYSNINLQGKTSA